MSKKLFSLCAVLVLGVAFIGLCGKRAQATDPVLPDNPLCVAWEVERAWKDGYYTDWDSYCCESITISELSYICVTPSGPKKYYARMIGPNTYRTSGTCGSHSYAGRSMYEPYMVELEICDGAQEGRLAYDDLGFPIKGYLMTSTASPIIEFAVYSHATVGGFSLPNEDWGSMAPGHFYWGYSGGYEWKSPGWSDETDD